MIGGILIGNESIIGVVGTKPNFTESFLQKPTVSPSAATQRNPGCNSNDHAENLGNMKGRIAGGD